MSQILPRLWIASVDTVRDIAFLRNNNVTHILNCAAEEPSLYPPVLAALLTSKHIPLNDGDDDDDENAYAQILYGSKLLDVWLRNINNTIVVHCKAGISRSVAMVMAWMMLYDGRSFEEAFESIQKVRMFIFPNSYYVRVLRGLEGWTNNGLRDYL